MSMCGNHPLLDFMPVRIDLGPFWVSVPDEDVGVVFAHCGLECFFEVRVILDFYHGVTFLSGEIRKSPMVPHFYSTLPQ